MIVTGATGFIGSKLCSKLCKKKEYSITKDEVKLLNELSISKEDAELYTDLKRDRHDASYATKTKFNQETIKNYENKVLDFINKTEEILE